MTAPVYNTVAWFQIGSNEPEEVKKFYGDLFGWTFARDSGFDGNYDMVSYADDDRPHGGVVQTPDAAANHATFCVIVADVAATVATAERLGAKVLVPTTTTGPGLVFAELLDASGNHFGVFSPPAAL